MRKAHNPLISSRRSGTLLHAFSHPVTLFSLLSEVLLILRIKQGVDILIDHKIRKQPLRGDDSGGFENVNVIQTNSGSPRDTTHHLEEVE